MLILLKDPELLLQKRFKGFVEFEDSLVQTTEEDQVIDTPRSGSSADETGGVAVIVPEGASDTSTCESADEHETGIELGVPVLDLFMEFV